MDALQLYLPLIASVLGSGAFTAIFVQLRLWHRDHSRLKFARYVFDHTRSRTPWAASPAWLTGNQSLSRRAGRTLNRSPDDDPNDDNQRPSTGRPPRLTGR